jgi:hypothetical protein
MQRNTLLIVMVAAGSALCWWPVIIQPNLDLPAWKTPLIFLALITALATALSNEGAGWSPEASPLGSFPSILRSTLPSTMSQHRLEVDPLYAKPAFGQLPALGLDECVVGLSPVVRQIGFTPSVVVSLSAGRGHRQALHVNPRQCNDPGM